jgi:DNA-binding transcriptional LysR family regulator
MRLELRHLEMVCAIADHGSLNKAASALGLAPSALTGQLQRVERSLGGLLFERDRRGARPTRLGELVLDRARALIPAVADLYDAAASLACTADTSASCRIGSVRSPLLAGLMRRFVAESPDTPVTVHQSGSPAELAEMLAAGRVDCAVIGLCGGASAPQDRGIVWRDVAVDAVFVLVRSDHQSAQLDEVDLADFADVTWVAGGPYECCFDECFAAVCARAGFTIRGMHELDARTALELITAGEVVGLCQSSFQPPSGLRAVPIAGTPLTWRHIIGWRSTAPGLAEQLVRYAVAAYTDVIRGIPHRSEWLATRPSLGVREPGLLVASR